MGLMDTGRDHNLNDPLRGDEIIKDGGEAVDAPIMQDFIPDNQDALLQQNKLMVEKRNEVPGHEANVEAHAALNDEGNLVWEAISIGKEDAFASLTTGKAVVVKNMKDTSLVPINAEVICTTAPIVFDIYKTGNEVLGYGMLS
jgi:hypothetical protein